MYINVNGIEPIVDTIINIAGIKYVGTDYAFTSFNSYTNNSTVTVSANQILCAIASSYDVSYRVYVYTNNQNTSFTVSLNGNGKYKKLNLISNNTLLNFCDPDANVVLACSDNGSGDSLASVFYLNKSNFNLINF